ncbi:lipocalin family protein [Wenzhouxiangella sp. XN79A]|uniref:lipocalin family protein n=1 Tax=Wenzhouxiangella sp. XN79A TaxID=2724193 RepID=UPI00144AE3EE|nr:lipocalin family protein [Wenzhouxiangella sp. XN79A]NKI35513.1 lipocalin family protein [Wenzhouxiangella sp. XN79A]
MKGKKRWIPVGVLVIVGAFVLLVPRGGDQPPLVAEASVDLDRYLGTWYVIANIPYFAERGKVASRAVYRPRDDGRMDDLYFYRDDFGAAEESMEGVAWVVDKQSNARWKVRFFWPLTFDYVILDVDDDYRHVAVGHPSRNYGWVMAREPRIGEAEYQRLMTVFETNGYDTTEFLKVPQFPGQVGQPGFQSPDD